jgi:hypothetical protein
MRVLAFIEPCLPSRADRPPSKLLTERHSRRPPSCARCRAIVSVFFHRSDGAVSRCLRSPTRDQRCYLLRCVKVVIRTKRQFAASHQPGRNHRYRNRKVFATLTELRTNALAVVGNPWSDFDHIVHFESISFLVQAQGFMVLFLPFGS